MIVQATKFCGGCEEEKPLSQFDHCERQGFQSRCKQCRHEQYRAWRQRTPPADALFARCTARARRKGLECNLTIEWVEQKLAGACEVTGIPFVFDHGRHAFMPSIDRIDSSKPYTTENCRVVLWIVNLAKNDLDEEDFQSAIRRIAEAMLERR